MPIDDSYQRREILEEIRDLYLSRITDNKKRIVEIGGRKDLTKKGKRAEREPLLMANTVWRLRLAVVTDWLADIDCESSIRFDWAEYRKDTIVEGDSDG